MSNDEKVWRLEPLSFAGLVSGASHYQGRLHRPRGSDKTPIEVESILDAARAAALSTDDFTEKPGRLSNRYADRATMIQAAVAQFLDLADPGDRLVTQFAYLTGRDEDEDQILARCPERIDS